MFGELGTELSVPVRLDGSLSTQQPLLTPVMSRGRLCKSRVLTKIVRKPYISVREISRIVLVKSKPPLETCVCRCMYVCVYIYIYTEVRMYTLSMFLRSSPSAPGA